MHLFARVAELGTLSAAARERDAPVSQVSRTLARIEKACGARLIHRSTHGLSLTAEGTTFLGYCRRMLGTLDELEGEFAREGPSGLVRVAASTVVAQYQIVPSLKQLTLRHPAVQVELVVSDRLADLARDGIDIAIRTVSNLPETVVARRIGALGRGLFASPEYVARHGLPTDVEGLRRHTLVINSAVPMLNQWPFVVQGERVVFEAEGPLRSNDTNMTATMVLQGLGIGRLATLASDMLVRERRLVAVLPKLVDLNPVPVHAVTASGRHRLPKIRACIDFWAGWFARGEARQERAA
ncbi:MAG TPA: LysR family transcriptional regulator [Ramlibacter sp.]|nr:LysR family transcriptional regulator [Ramlibacter sp.]